MLEIYGVRTGSMHIRPTSQGVEFIVRKEAFLQRNISLNEVGVLVCDDLWIKIIVEYGVSPNYEKN